MDLGLHYALVFCKQNIASFLPITLELSTCNEEMTEIIYTEKLLSLQTFSLRSD